MKTKRIDEDLINAKFDIIEKNVSLLKEISQADEEEFIKNFKDVQAAKHCLQEAIESCIDISNHIISRKGFERVEKYQEMFTILEKNMIITGKLSKKLVDMTKFRNLLVHQYGRINEEELYSIINIDIKDIEDFEKEITHFLLKEKKEKSKE